MIIIDAREPKEIIEKLSKLVKVEEEFIECGDYLLSNGYAIERKCGGDFMSSVISNRLFEQLNNLMQYENPVLCIILDNIWKTFYFSRSKYIHKQYIGVLTTLTCKYPKLKIIFLDTDDVFVSYVKSLHNKLQEDGNSERPCPMMRRCKTVKMRKENCLTCIDGVGMTMSKKLIKKYGSINKVANAEIDDMIKIKKLGKKTAEKIKETLN